MTNFFRHIFLSKSHALASIALASLALMALPAYAKYTEIFTPHQSELSVNVNQPVLIADVLPQVGAE